MLCKHIAVEIADIRPSKLLEDGERTRGLNQLSSPKGVCVSWRNYIQSEGGSGVERICVYN